VTTPGKYFIAAVLTLFLSSACAFGQLADKNEEEAIIKKAAAFVAAFDSGDAKSIAGFWTPDGIYRDQKGNETKGRTAIEQMFQAFFAANKGLKLRINVGAMRMVTKDVVIEEGTTEVITPDGAPPSVAHYVILHVKKDGDWYLDIVKDSVYVAPTNYKHLSGLEWAIGDWADDKEHGNIGRLSLTWGSNQNYIVGTFATTFKNISLNSGTQWIAWDPKSKQIRSWTFDNSGNFGEGWWSHKGNQWLVKTSTTLGDGKTVTATNVITMIDADTITWQSTNRAVDGKALPDIPAVKMKRVK
jgi:uncharacterized protein (TIGR02246 family)